MSKRMKRISICSHCGAEFHSLYGRKGLFCSRDCYFASLKKDPIIKICVQCGNEFEVHSYQMRRKGHGRYCSRKCHYSSRRYNPHKDISTPEGRVLVYAPDNPMANRQGRVYRYRLIASEQIGRPLTSEETVHHANTDCSDDEPSNLEIKTPSSHMKEHGILRAKARGYNPFTQKICRICKQIKCRDQFSPSTNRGRKTLSSACKPCSAQWQREYRKLHPEVTSRARMQTNQIRRKFNGGGRT